MFGFLSSLRSIGRRLRVHIVVMLLRTNHLVAEFIEHHFHFGLSSQAINGQRVGISRCLEIATTVIIDGIADALGLVELDAIVLELLVGKDRS